MINIKYPKKILYNQYANVEANKIIIILLFNFFNSITLLLIKLNILLTNILFLNTLRINIFILFRNKIKTATSTATVISNHVNTRAILKVKPLLSSALE